MRLLSSRRGSSKKLRAKSRVGRGRGKGKGKVVKASVNYASVNYRDCVRCGHNCECR